MSKGFEPSGVKSRFISMLEVFVFGSFKTESLVIVSNEKESKCNQKGVY